MRQRNADQVATLHTRFRVRVDKKLTKKRDLAAHKSLCNRRKPVLRFAENRS